MLELKVLKLTGRPHYDFFTDPFYGPDDVLSKEEYNEAHYTKDDRRQFKVYKDKKLILSVPLFYNRFSNEWSYNSGHTTKVEYFTDSQEHLLEAYKFLVENEIQPDMVLMYSMNNWDLSSFTEDFSESVIHIMDYDSLLKSYNRKMRQNIKHSIRDYGHLVYRELANEEEWIGYAKLISDWYYMYNMDDLTIADRFSTMQYDCIRTLEKAGVAKVFGIFDKDTLIGGDSMFYDATGDIWIADLAPYKRDEYKIGNYIIVRAIEQLHKLGAKKYSLSPCDTGADDFFKMKWAHEIRKTYAIGFGRWEFRENPPIMEAKDLTQIRKDLRHKFELKEMENDLRNTEGATI